MTTQPIFHVVAAQAAANGQQVYLTGCDEWSSDIMHAEFIDNAEHADFRLFVASRQDRVVKAPRLTPVEIGENGPVPPALFAAQ